VQARSALFVLFGDIVAPAGGEAWLSTLTGLMGALDLSPEATRTALHRMAAEGWVAPRKQGRYSAYQLTPKGVARLEAAAARIYSLRSEAWDGRWRLLVGASPRGTAGAQLGRDLAWLGFGHLGDGVWVSPRDPGERLDGVLDEHGVAATHRFTAEPGSPLGDRRVVAAAWDLEELRAAQQAFIDRWTAEPAVTAPQAAFRQRIEVVHHWRSFLFLDPGLPEALLPPDWLGHRAAAAFRERYEAVEAPAWSFVAEISAGSPDGPALVPQQPPSPFALGLDLEEPSRA
jgi:phenylacetic acid degradation operon negative regulatory protein